MTFDYFYGQESDQFSFYRIPKSLFTADCFQELSTDSKLLYGLLLDRMSLSAKNGWIDKNGRVFIYFTIEDIKGLLKYAEKKVIRLLNEIEGCGLIERKRQGLCKPNIIYVKNFIREQSNGQFRNCQNNNSGIGNISPQDTSEGQSNNSNRNNNYFNNTEESYSGYPISCGYNPILSDSLESDGMGSDYAEKRESIREYLIDQLEMEILNDMYPNSHDTLEEILEIILDTLCSTRPTIRISGEDKPIDSVKSAFWELDSSHIVYVMDCLRKNTSDIRNIRSYLLTSLFNSVYTISNYYSSQIRHDMPYLAK